MENFFGAIPDLFSSERMDLLFPTSLPSQCQDVLKEALDQFMDHTFRSTTVVESVKARALTALHLLVCLPCGAWSQWTSRVLNNILNGNWLETTIC